MIKWYELIQSRAVSICVWTVIAGLLIASIFPIAATHNRNRNHRITNIDQAIVTIYTSYGQGSGVIVDPSGIILTAAHVIDGWSEPYIVELYDGTQYKIEDEFYVNEELDVTIISIDPNEPLPFVELVPSDQYKIGTEIWILGTPFGHTQWHSYGHIAAQRIEEEIFLDIDANPGHSGGPIFVGDKCIGIIVAGFYATDMSIGICSEICISVLDIYNTLYGD